MKYSSIFGEFQIINLLLSLAIVLQNLISRIIFIELTKVIKFTSNSARMRIVLISVFLIYFMNYGVLYLLAPMKVDIPGLERLPLVGIYFDFNLFWYSDIGNQIISVMVINAVFPPIEVAFIWIWSFIR